MEFTWVYVCAMITNKLCLSVIFKGTKPQVPLKLKGHRFFFLLDKEGEFMQPTLFDKTVGIKRFWKMAHRNANGRYVCKQKFVFIQNGSKQERCQVQENGD